MTSPYTLTAIILSTPQPFLLARRSCGSAQALVARSIKNLPRKVGYHNKPPAVVQGKRWVERLLGDEYDVLTFEERLEAALDLMHLALDMPTVRATLDRRSDEVERAKKLMRDAAKAERHQRQLELARRAKRDAEEAARRVATLRAEMAAAEMAAGMLS
jgi:hypothetical protein